MEKIKKETAFVKVALGIFAKTVGRSPIKTRLAVDTSVAFAEQFYSLSVNVMAELATLATAQTVNVLNPHWALAEPEAVKLECWSQFPALWTGEGNLGVRLNSIYKALHKDHDAVILMGSDSPMLQPKLIVSVIQQLSNNPQHCIIGPCFDGGFYLFAGAKPIPKTVWSNVSYSSSKTLQELLQQLDRVRYSVTLLAELGDVDTVEDLEYLTRELELSSVLLASQQYLLAWLEGGTVVNTHLEKN